MLVFEPLQVEFEPQYWNASHILQLTREADPTRLVDFNSGGPGNALGLGDVNDVHTYPWPVAPEPSTTQYAMVGEYGGIGWHPVGHEWLQDGCGNRSIMVNSSAAGRQAYIVMLDKIAEAKTKNQLSAAVCVAPPPHKYTPLPPLHINLTPTNAHVHHLT